jgi:ribose transport system substrate-binding protein
MHIQIQRLIGPSAAILAGALCGGALTFLFAAIHARSSLPVIAFVPRATGTIFAETMHRGAQDAARNSGYRIYWNGATREDDLDRQILIAEKAVNRGAKALILGPTSVGGVTSMVNSLVARKVPVVIVQALPPVPVGPYLTAVTPDQCEIGKLAAKRIAQAIGTAGQVAIVGIDRGFPETLARAESFMKTIAAYPDIEVVARSHGSVQISESEQNTREIVESLPRVKAIYAVSADATQGAMLALQDVDRSHAIVLVGSDRDLFLADELRDRKLDSLVSSDAYRIGYLAMRAAIMGAQGHPLQSPTVEPAELLTPANVLINGH